MSARGRGAASSSRSASTAERSGRTAATISTGGSTAPGCWTSATTRSMTSAASQQTPSFQLVGSDDGRSVDLDALVTRCSPGRAPGGLRTGAGDLLGVARQRLRVRRPQAGASALTIRPRASERGIDGLTEPWRPRRPRSRTAPRTPGSALRTVIWATGHAPTFRHRRPRLRPTRATPARRRSGRHDRLVRVRTAVPAASTLVLHRWCRCRRRGLAERVAADRGTGRRISRRSAHVCTDRPVGLRMAERVLVAGHVGDEHVAPAAHRSDHTLRLTVVARCLPRCLDPRRQGRLADEAVTPDLVQQLLLRHQAGPVLDEITTARRTPVAPSGSGGHAAQFVSARVESRSRRSGPPSRRPVRR